jgi:hypothetical protein
MSDVSYAFYPFKVSSLSCHKRTQYTVTARLVLPKYCGRKGSKGENNNAPAEAGALLLDFAWMLLETIQSVHNPFVFPASGVIHQHVMPQKPSHSTWNLARKSFKIPEQDDNTVQPGASTTRE